MPLTALGPKPYSAVGGSVQSNPAPSEARARAAGPLSRDQHFALFAFKRFSRSISRASPSTNHNSRSLQHADAFKHCISFDMLARRRRRIRNRKMGRRTGLRLHSDENTVRKTCFMTNESKSSSPRCPITIKIYAVTSPRRSEASIQNLRPHSRRYNSSNDLVSPRHNNLYRNSAPHPPRAALVYRSYNWPTARDATRLFANF
ncbi:hypothetical protein EVAR_86098_1 [Eumeta japonica]|uniref:Uncharacterized protein n=1 Tax=Eumeta variegata TaxID=151549 RepID=A0A4C1V1R7_EUMVA|nr:hypothetical protein EVAR_86098_1 [Eumeta japonica]